MEEGRGTGWEREWRYDTLLWMKLDGLAGAGNVYRSADKIGTATCESRQSAGLQALGMMEQSICMADRGIDVSPNDRSESKPTKESGVQSQQPEVTA
jgi:hypothetical protein